MFVQEEKIFAGKVLRLHICAADGAEWLEEATEDTSVEKLKERCLKHVRPGPRSAPPRSDPEPRLDLGPDLDPRQPQLPGPLRPLPGSEPGRSAAASHRAAAPRATRSCTFCGGETDVGKARGCPASLLACSWGEVWVFTRSPAS